jgi:hypothetical protein
MKQLDIVANADTVTLTKAEKLVRWASLIRKHREPIAIYHELEHWDRSMRQQPLIPPHGTASAFTIAGADPVFASLGLGSTPSLDDVTKFFELNREQVHAFSCDCGGHITNEEQARRIESFARPVRSVFSSYLR